MKDCACSSHGLLHQHGTALPTAIPHFALQHQGSEVRRHTLDLPLAHAAHHMRMKRTKLRHEAELFEHDSTFKWSHRQHWAASVTRSMSVGLSIFEKDGSKSPWGPSLSDCMTCCGAYCDGLQMPPVWQPCSELATHCYGSPIEHSAVGRKNRAAKRF